MNPDTKTTTDQLKAICHNHGIAYASHQRITYGFSHEVHRINDDLVIKIFDARHKAKFQTERAALASRYTFQKPELIASGTPSALMDRYYIIMSFVPGKSVGSVWHEASDIQREGLIAAISKNLQIINAISPESMELEVKPSWQAYVLGRLDDLTHELAQKGILESSTVERVKHFAHSNRDVLLGGELRTVYWDIHFDNFIVGDAFELQALIDLENIEHTALDYPLFVIRKQMRDPAKYLSLDDEQYAKKEDYAKLETWYRKYYPEMFAVDDLEQRIRFYELLDTLHLLREWSQVGELYEILEELVADAWLH